MAVTSGKVVSAKKSIRKKRVSEKRQPFAKKDCLSVMILLKVNYLPETTLSVSRAIASSSFVGMT